MRRFLLRKPQYWSVPVVLVMGVFIFMSAYGAESTSLSDSHSSIISEDNGTSTRAIGLAIGAAIVMLGGALGTGWVQASVMPSVAALAAEDKSFRVFGIILVALPETILLLSLVISYMMIAKI